MNECVSCDYPEPCGGFHQVAYFERGGVKLNEVPTSDAQAWEIANPLLCFLFFFV